MILLSNASDGHSYAFHAKHILVGVHNSSYEASNGGYAKNVCLSENVTSMGGEKRYSFAWKAVRISNFKSKVGKVFVPVQTKWSFGFQMIKL